MIDVDFEHCTGCEACFQACPQKCISIQRGEFDFLYPQVDKERCIDCHLCEKVCPIDNTVNKPIEQQAYAAVNKDKQVLLNSTSGAAFSALADGVLSDNGVVYGCSMDRMQVHHIRVTDAKNLGRLRGSKYVQSSIGDTFRQAEEDLKSGKKVLFSGTPCQIAGLTGYLRREYDNLITVDIVCHGVGSQAYFDKFLSSLNYKDEEVKALKFRSKKYTGWSCSSGELITEDKAGKKKSSPFYYHKNYYYRFFLAGDIYRKSCYSCKYANLNRVGDITLGDFWGVERLHLPLNTYNGCSLVITNTSKGSEFLNKINSLNVVKVELKDAVKDNAQLSHPSVLRNVRQERLHDYEMKSGNEIEYDYEKNDKFGIMKGEIKKMIPYSVKKILWGGTMIH